MATDPSEAVQDYLKAIHSLGGADRVVSPADIATGLGVKAPSVTGMFKRLAEAVVDDPPDFASFLAHASIGGKAPAGTETVTDGRVVRLSPLVLGDFSHGVWQRPAWNELPARLGGRDLFARLQQLGAQGDDRVQNAVSTGVDDLIEGSGFSLTADAGTAGDHSAHVRRGIVEHHEL